MKFFCQMLYGKQPQNKTFFSIKILIDNDFSFRQEIIV